MYVFDSTTGVITIKERYVDGDGTIYLVTGIADGGFSQTKIQEVLGEDGAFSATDITGFKLPRYLDLIGSNAFTGLTNLATFTVDTENKHFKVDADNILFNYDMTKIIRYPSLKNDLYYTVPDGVKDISADAFCDNTYCTAIVTTLYHNKAWGLPAGIMLNTAEFLDTITNITGDVEAGYTVYLDKASVYETVVLQGNDDPDNNFYGEPENVVVQQNQVGDSFVMIDAVLCSPCTEHGNYSGIYLSSWQDLAYACLTDDKTLEIHNCRTAIVGGEIYQWVDDENHKVVTNEHLYNLPSSAGDFNFLPDTYKPWSDLKKSSVLKVKVVDSIAPDTLIYGTYIASNGYERNHTWFNNMTNCTEMDLAKLNTSKVTDMSYMFINCKNLQSLDLSSFNTENVTNMYCMFYLCHNLASLDVSNFNTKNVTDMRVMFSECKALTSLDVSSFDTSKVTNMQSMFNLCEALKSLDLSKFDTGKVKNMSHMFQDAKALTTLDLSNFNTEKVADMYQMFTNCSALQSLDISGFDTSKVTTNMEQLFKGSSSLKTIIVSGSFVVKSNATTTNMFLECKALVGGNGTTYDSNYVGKTYARIDGVSGKGYFTAADHTHSEDIVWKSNGDETHSKYCSVYGELHSPEPHSYGEGIVDTVSGVTTYTCSVCGHTKTTTPSEDTTGSEENGGTETASNEQESSVSEETTAPENVAADPVLFPSESSEEQPQDTETDPQGQE